MLSSNDCKEFVDHMRSSYHRVIVSGAVATRCFNAWPPLKAFQEEVAGVFVNMVPKPYLKLTSKEGQAFQFEIVHVAHVGKRTRENDGVVTWNDLFRGE